MADDVAVTPGIGASVATDEVGGRHFQRVKLTHGADGTATDVSAASPLPVSAPAALPVDSELPAAAALTDAMANPTAPAVASHGMLWNGATWDRAAGKEEGTLLALAARTVTTQSPVVTSPNARGVILTLRISVASGTGGLAVDLRGYGGPGTTNWWWLLGASAEKPAPATQATNHGFMYYPGVTPVDPAASSGSVYLWFRAAVALPRRWYAIVTPADASAYTYELTYVTLP